MSRSAFKNLIIIGNGFDLWRGIPSSYEKFRQYYHANIHSITQKLGGRFYSVKGENGIEKEITAVELIYGDPFKKETLDDEFFWNLEARMDKLDDEIINEFFGRSKDNISELRKTVEEATFILKTIFCNWVQELQIKPENSGYLFGNDCFVINFNYTDTVEKQFGIPKSNIFHIHGKAEDPTSIIVGHSSHPEKPFEELINQKFLKPVVPGKGLPRIEGLYAVEEALYKTDKHIEDNIDSLCVHLLKCGVHIEDFEHIYVLGHSFAEADIPYFRFIHSVTQCGCDYETLSAWGRMDLRLLWALTSGEEVAEDLLYALIIENIQYAVHHRERVAESGEELHPEYKAIDDMFGGQIPYKEGTAKQAVYQRFLFEQAGRKQELLKRLESEYYVPIPEGCHSILGYADYKDRGHDLRKRNALWHISYHSKEDKKRIERAMKDLHLKRYSLFPSIDECIREFSR